MASNRDPRPSYRRRNRKTITSSSNRSTRSKKSTAPKPTSSSTRASTKGSSSRVTTGQGGSRARVKTKAKSTGLIGSTGNAPKRYVGPKTPGVKFNPSKRLKTPAVKTRTGGGNNLRSTAAAALVAAAAAGSLRNPISKAKAQEKLQKAETLRQKNVSTGTNKDNRPKQGAGLDMKRIKAEDKKAKTIKSFDSAFASARKAGKKTFTWNGKLYTTKTK